MTPGRYNIKCYAGATLDQSFLWMVGEEPVDVTGFFAKMDVKQACCLDEPPMVSFDSNFNYMEVGDADGRINLYVPPTVTRDLESGCHVYNLKMSIGDDAYILLEGNFEVSPEVTV